MGIVVAIGGFSNSINDIKGICNKIIELSKKEKPHILYIPTANNDHKEYSTYMMNFFQNNYSCRVSILWLLNENVVIDDIDNKIKEADIVFVEGGNLIKLLETWKKYKIGERLKKAYNKGTIMAGISAGANCWFEYSYSDSIKTKKYGFVKCLDFVKGCICPHYNHDERKREFNKEIKKNKGIAGPIYTIEDNNALVLSDSGVSMIKEKNETLIKLG